MQFAEKVLDQPKIRVVIRKRPLNKKEIARNEQDVVEVSNNDEIVVREQKAKVDLTRYVQEHQFKFDYALDQHTSNSEMYNQCVRPIVRCAFMGAKVTCFAYGQTGSGKTFTMNGDVENGVLGMYYLGAEDIFTQRNHHHQGLDVYVSFYEIYCGKLFDLLNSREQLQAREDAKQNVNIIGLTVKKVNSIQDFMDTISYGSSVRITSQNSTNADSSRSHAILQIELRQSKKTLGKISFIDLAGCQRGADTLDQNKQTKIDGAEINKSLLALKQCIRALDLGKNHTPFRGSKLTMVLKDSFTGFCKTLMIGNISPGSGSCQNTLNTLRYADRVKQLKKGGGQQIISKQERLAKQLMLPRNNGKTKLIITNESDSEQDRMPQLKEKNSNISIPFKKIPVQAVSKKPKYIIKDDNDRKNNNYTPQPQPIQPPRKNIMNSQVNLHAQQLKSVNPGHRRSDLQRNKSVLGRQKVNPSANTSWINNRVAQVPAITERNNFHKNHSVALNQRELKDINIQIQQHLNGIQKSIEIQLTQWDKAVEKFKKWQPSPHTFGQMSLLFEEMVKMIMKEQLQISELHKSVLLKEQKQHRELMSLYNETQTDNKNNEEMHEYAGRLAHHLDLKLRACSQLKSRAQLYQIHLREHQYCESRLMELGQSYGQAHFQQQYCSAQYN